MSSFTKEEEINFIKAFITYVEDSYELKKLQNCTQMMDDGARDASFGLTNRGQHSTQVAINAMKLHRLRNGRSTTGKDNTAEDLLAYTVGLCHDLGHTPMGHNTEVVIGNKIGGKFSHATMSGPIFLKLFDEFVADYGGKPLNKEFISEVRRDILTGVQQHGTYLSSDFKDDSTQKDYVACGMLADTLSFMTSDLADLINREIINREDLEELLNTGKIVGRVTGEAETRLDDSQPLAERGNLPKIKDDNGQEYTIIEALESKDSKVISALQTQIATEAMAHSKDNRPETISDDIKILREIEIGLRRDNVNDYEWGIKKYVSLHPKEFGISSETYTINEVDVKKDEDEILITVSVNGNKYTIKPLEILNTKMNELRESCPTLAYVYELQDELSYNQVLGRSPEKLGNDSATNQEAISALFDQYKAEYSKRTEKDESFLKMYEYMIENMSPFKEEYQAAYTAKDEKN